jgi:hypothetical protein
MSKFKVGDKVRIRKCDTIDELYWGYTGTLVSKADFCDYLLRLDKPAWTPDNTILVDEEELEKIDV